MAATSEASLDDEVRMPELSSFCKIVELEVIGKGRVKSLPEYTFTVISPDSELGPCVSVDD